MHAVPFVLLTFALPWRATAHEVQECADQAPDCADEACDEVQEVSLLQRRQAMKPSRSMAGSAASAEARKECSPCEVHEPCGEATLRMDIYTPKENGQAARPVVLAFHGVHGTEKSMKPHCRNVFVKAGFVCVAIDPLNDPQEPSLVTEHAIKHLVAHAGEYNADAENMFLYGYSMGGHSDLYFEMWSDDDSTRERVKGMISDCSAPGDNRFDWSKKDSEKRFRQYPPYLMMHCSADPVMKPSWSIKKSVKNIDKSNKERPSNEQILYHTLKFHSDTGCKHQPLLLHSDAGREAAVKFINHIVAGEDPFDGIPDFMEGPESFY